MIPQQPQDQPTELQKAIAASNEALQLFYGNIVSLPREILEQLSSAAKRVEGLEKTLTNHNLTHTRDGNWVDRWGACKVCDGEIPDGHTEECDIYKKDKEITTLKLRLSEVERDKDDIVKESHNALSVLTDVAKERDSLKAALRECVEALKELQKEHGLGGRHFCLDCYNITTRVLSNPIVQQCLKENR